MYTFYSERVGKLLDVALRVVNSEGRGHIDSVLIIAVKLD